MTNWTVVAIPEQDGKTTLTRTYIRRGIEAVNALDAICKAAEPGAAQIRRLMDLMWGDAHDQAADYDKARTALLAVLRSKGDTP